MQKKQTLKRSESGRILRMAIALITIGAWASGAFGPCALHAADHGARVRGAAVPPRAKRVASVAGYVVLGHLACRFSGGRPYEGHGAPRGGFIIWACHRWCSYWRRLPSSKVLGCSLSTPPHCAFLAISYVWLAQLMVVGMSPMAAFLAGIAPFILLDAIKIVIGVGLATAARPFRRLSRERLKGARGILRIARVRTGSGRRFPKRTAVFRYDERIARGRCLRGDSLLMG